MLTTNPQADLQHVFRLRVVERLILLFARVIRHFAQTEHHGSLKCTINENRSLPDTDGRCFNNRRLLITDVTSF